MVGRLSWWGVVAGAGTPWGRRVAALALAMAVIAVHGCVAEQMADRMTDFHSDAAMPLRVEVAYVREMEMSAPPSVAPAPALAKVAKRPRVAAPKPAASAASAVETPQLTEPPMAASEPAAIASEPPERPPVAAAEPEPPKPETATAAPVAAAASAPAFEWPASTRLSYVLSGQFKGEVHGSAQVEWVRLGPRYQVHADVIVGLTMMPLMSRKMTSEGQLTPDGLSPDRYDEVTKVGIGDPKRATIRFESDGILMPGGRRRERSPGVQDAASLFVQLTYLFTTQPELLKTGNIIEVPLALPRNVDRWIYDVLAQETLYTPFGAVDAMHVKPRRVARRGSDMTAEMWFAPTLSYLPVRILIRQDDETFIDLVIRRKPQLASQ